MHTLNVQRHSSRCEIAKHYCSKFYIINLQSTLLLSHIMVNHCSTVVNIQCYYQCWVKKHILFLFISPFLYNFCCGWCILWFQSLYHKDTPLPLWFGWLFSIVRPSAFCHSKRVKCTSSYRLCHSVFTRVFGWNSNVQYSKLHISTTQLGQMLCSLYSMNEWFSNYKWTSRISLGLIPEDLIY